MVLTITESQEKNDFQQLILPTPVLVLSTAYGDTIINKTTKEHLISHVLPMIVQAYDDNDARFKKRS